MAIGIDPTVDYAFKRLFGSQENIPLVIHFLNALLTGMNPITEVELLNPILEQDDADDRLAILDVRAKDDHGRWLNIEMQTTIPLALPQRLTFYAASLYTLQMREGDQYQQLRPAITICVLSRLLFRDVPDLHLDFRLSNLKHQLVLNDDLQIHFLELPKCRTLNDNLEGASLIEKWAYFLRYVSKLTPAEITQRLPDPVFAQATGVLQMIAKTPRERELYEARIKQQRDEYARLQGAIEQGLQEGRERGVREGFEQGIEQGIEKGIVAGEIRLLQKLLGLPVTDAKVLVEMDDNLRKQLYEDLERKIRDRN